MTTSRRTAEDACRDWLSSERLVAHPLYPRTTSLMESTFRQCQRPVLSTQLLTGTIDKTELEWVRSCFCRIEVILQLQVGVRVDLDECRGSKGWLDKISEG